MEEGDDAEDVCLKSASSLLLDEKVHFKYKICDIICPIFGRIIMKNSDTTKISKINNKLLTAHDFFFESPLYKEFSYEDFKEFDSLLSEDIDAYSVKNETETTYEISEEWIEEINIKFSPHKNVEGFQLVTLQCKRKYNDILRYFLYNDQIGKKIMKVGQIPSIASLQFSDLEKKYNKVLEKQYLEEFKKAIVSASHGYGVAAFVYLRRIFENLINTTFQENHSKYNCAQVEFSNKKMAEKIELLKENLPPQLIKMKKVYGVLSLGVHELNEEDCLSYFGPLKLSIELILDDKIEIHQKILRNKKVEDELQQITHKLSTKNKVINDTPI